MNSAVYVLISDPVRYTDFARNKHQTDRAHRGLGDGA